MVFFKLQAKDYRFCARNKGTKAVLTHVVQKKAIDVIKRVESFAFLAKLAMVDSRVTLLLNTF